MTWLLSVLGLEDASGRPYLLWSGSGATLIPLAVQLATFGLLFFWHHQCAVHRCRRYARRTTAAGDRACRRHHPEPEPTAADIRAAHHAMLPLYQRRTKGGDA